MRSEPDSSSYDDYYSTKKTKNGFNVLFKKNFILFLFASATF